MLQEELLYMLVKSEEPFISGQTLADHFSVSRNAVWKAINSLKEKGYNIESVGKKGYRVSEHYDILVESVIRKYLSEYIKHSEIKVLSSVDSTNNEAKRILIGDDLPDSMIIVSDTQTKGRGKNNTNFYSPAKTGLYMTLVYHVGREITDTDKVINMAGSAVKDALISITGCNDFKVQNGNEIYYENKKVCGILTEAVVSLETKITEYLICGIGINIATENFPENENNIGALTDFYIERNKLVSNIVNRLMPLYEGLIFFN